MDPVYSRSYGDLQTWHWWHRGRVRVLDAALRRELGHAQPLRVVSVGCGPATGLTWLEGLAGPEGVVLGLDAEHWHGDDVPPGVRFTQASAEAIPLRRGAFDAALLLDVLEHLDDDARALGEVAASLKPGGLLFVTVPAFPSLWGRQDVVSHHRRRYTRRTLEACFAAAGLGKPALSYLNTLLFPPVAAVRWARRALGDGGSDGAGESDLDDNHPGLLNEVLERTFALERFLVFKAPLPFGVSLAAKLRVP